MGRRRHPCGTRGAYCRGCRCEPCRAANGAYQAAWLAAHPEAAARKRERKNAHNRTPAGRAARRATRARNAEHYRAVDRDYYRRNTERVKAGTAAAREREQARTVATSTKHGTPWTTEDEQALIRLYGTMTAGEVAIRLNRTAFGIRNRVVALRRRGEL